MPTINELLEERGTRYGIFSRQANIAQELKEIIHMQPKYHELMDDQKEALDMIAHKIARILNGDPGYADTWDDIAGYAQLVSNRLKGKLL